MVEQNASGVTIHSETGGTGGPALLLLHGLGATGDTWQGVLERMRRDWPGRVVVPDLRGHGRSGWRAPYSYAGHAADMASLFAQDEEIVVAGHSMGALVAIALASGWFGVRVRAVAAFGVKLRWQDGEEAKMRAFARTPVRWFDTREAALERYLKVAGLFGLVDPSAPMAAAGIQEEGGRFRLAADPMINAVAGPAVENFVSVAQAPIRWGAGAADPMVSAADMRPFDSAPALFAGCGHNAHVEDPEAVWQFIREAVAVEAQAAG